jgi:hypothetical protein
MNGSLALEPGTTREDIFQLYGYTLSPQGK